MKKINFGEMGRNLACNWYFPFCSAAFYCAIVQWCNDGSHIPAGIGLAFLICGVFAAVSGSFSRRIQQMPWLLKALAAMTATGIFWDPAVIPLGGLSFGDEAAYLNSLVEQLRLPALFGDLATVAAWMFAFVCVALLFEKLLHIFVTTGLFRGVTGWELAAYALLLIASCGVITAAFTQSAIFYGEGIGGSVIYTGDSNLIVPMSAYVNLFHCENDIRQPLFAVFAAPLTGLSYFLGAWVYRWPTAQMLLLAFSQMLLIFFGSFVLARTLELTPGKRIWFMALFCCTNMYIVFILMLEQYAVAFFWLMLCVYTISIGAPEGLTVIGAGGTLLTSLAIVPLAQGKNPMRDFKGWFWGCAGQGIAYVLAVFAFCRLDVLLELLQRSQMLSNFTGKEVSAWNKVLQYFNFIRGCFLPPQTYVNPVGDAGPARWQVPVTAVSLAGVVLLVLALVSIWLNRKKRISLLCGYWLAFSVVILAVVGWGTSENGLMLYGLYFGWAYFTLLFQLVQWAAQKLAKPWLVSVCSAVGIAVMLLYNVPEIVSIIDFAKTYYPG